MSLFTKLSTLARSPQGKKAMRQAQEFAQSPEGKRKLASLRERVAGGRKPGPGR